MKILAIAFSFCLMINPALGKFMTTHTAPQIQQEVDKLLSTSEPSRVWVVFDIYHTLVHPSHPATHANNMMEKYKDIFKEIFKSLTLAQAEKALNLSIEHEKGLVLIDPEFPSLIRSLQDRKIIVSCLTTSMAHEFGTVKNLKDWTYTYFKEKLDIDFDRSSPFSNEKNFSLPLKSSHPGFYYKGIFFTNGENGLTKGEALVLMIKEAPQKPTVIVMVDDREKNLVSIQEELQKYDDSIRFVGILFKGGLSASHPCTEQEFISFWKHIADQAKQ